jgi:hypothetical protein
MRHEVDMRSLFVVDGGTDSAFLANSDCGQGTCPLPASSQPSEPTEESGFLAVRAALFAYNWDDIVAAVQGFCASRRAAIPSWYEDELLFAAMQLWVDDRPVDVLRHFARFFSRATGHEIALSDDDNAVLHDRCAYG